MVLVVMFYRVHCLFILIASFSLLCVASAQDENIPIIIQNDSSITYRWHDGREARMRFTPIDMVEDSVLLTMTKNTCNAAQAVTCRYGFSVGSRRAALVWTKNPKAKHRIGRTVVRLDAQPSNPKDLEKAALANRTLVILVPLLPHFWEDPVVKAEPERFRETLQCDNYDWLPQGKETVSINRWNVDFESQAFESKTGNITRAENSFTTSARQVPLRWRDSDSRLVIGMPKYLGAISPFFASFIVGYKIEIQVNRAEAVLADTATADPVCKVGFSIDFGKIFQAFTKAFSSTERDNSSSFSEEVSPLPPIVKRFVEGNRIYLSADKVF
jgi:hypothetical protein